MTHCWGQVQMPAGDVRSQLWWPWSWQGQVPWLRAGVVRIRLWWPWSCQVLVLVLLQTTGQLSALCSVQATDLLIKLSVENYVRLAASAMVV